jgi:hypothetical protein
MALIVTGSVEISRNSRTREYTGGLALQPDFELFTGFNLHTIHTPKIVRVMLSVGIVITHNSPIV